MRPLRIELEGFSGFRAPATIDFEGADLIAFVGPTGSGKSSIIDALTFALYGAVARYDDRRVVEPAIHKLCQEAKVRLEFELAGCRYTAVRVVRRRGTGATTKESRLTRHESDGTETVLAGTERDLSDAVRRLLGLDFEQFTKTCVLPQGEFAEFLHADRRSRQELLRQLLDVGVYARMGQFARARADEASTRAQLLQEQVDADPPLDDDSLSALKDRVAALDALIERLPVLLAVRREVEEQAHEVARRERELTDVRDRLEAVSLPPAVVELASRLEAAEAAAKDAADALEVARRRRDEAQAAKQDGPDTAQLQRAVVAAERLDELTTELSERVPRVGSLTEELVAAHAAAESAQQELAAAESQLEAAKDAAGLGAVISGLTVGEPCPVCRQVVQVLPGHDVGAELKAARAAHRKAADTAKAAAAEVSRLTAEHDALERRVADLEKERDRCVADVGDRDLAEVRAQVEAAQQLDIAVSEALKELKARERHESKTSSALAELHEEEVALRRELSAIRDRLADRHPPASAGQAVLEDWQAFVAWAGTEHATVAEELTALKTRARALAEERQAALRAIETACAAADVAVSDPDRAGEQVSAAHARMTEQVRHAEERRAHAAEVRDQITQLQERATLNALLGQLLRADGFERWLLQAALDRLVERATDRLRELSGGQFSLVSEEGDFLIRDHRNADELRNVRTLSGGETFLASLALALALAEDIAELATAGAPRIESMFLDEGFGMLDPDTLDVVAAAIEELAASGRLIGIVTHVRDLADRMPVRFEVTKDPTTSRVERVEA